MEDMPDKSGTVAEKSSVKLTANSITLEATGTAASSETVLQAMSKIASEAKSEEDNHAD